MRTNREHGSAEWGKSTDWEKYRDFENYDNNVILTNTELLTMSSGKGASDRNKNILAIGGSGAGKTLFFVKPNLMQTHSSYCTTDPKGGVLKETGAIFVKAGYKIKVFNTVDFAESMHYNPFHYFLEDHLQEDIAVFIDVFMQNTGNKSEGGDGFWNKAEKLLYTAYIALIFTLFPKEERNMITVCELVTNSGASEEDENAQSAVDVIFGALEEWLGGATAEQLNENYLNMNFTDLK